MAEIFNNFLTGTLAANINSSVTTMTMIYSGGISTAIPTFVNLTHSFRLRIADELIKVTGSSFASGVYTFTIVRAVEGTTAASHTAGDQVHFVLTAGALDDRFAANGWGLSSNRSESWNEGTMYIASDSVLGWRDNGSFWEPFGPIWVCDLAMNQSYTLLNGTNSGASLAASAGNRYMPRASFTGVATLQLGLIYWSAPATPYVIDAMLSATWTPTADPRELGICFYNTSTTKLQTISYDGSQGYLQLRGSRYDSLTSWNSDDLASIEMSHEQCRWLRLSNDGTNLKAFISADRINWMQAWSVPVGTFMTPNAYGMFGYSTGTGKTMYGKAFSLGVK